MLVSIAKTIKKAEEHLALKKNLYSKTVKEHP